MYCRDRSNILGYDNSNSSSGNSGSSEIFAVGSIIAYYGYVAPVNWLLCTGDSFDQAIYPELFVLLGSNILPDLRGQVLKGIQNSRLIGNKENDQTGPHQHSFTATSDASGNVQATIPQFSIQQPLNLTTDSQGAHTHTVNYSANTTGVGNGYESGSTNSGTYATNSAGAHVHNINTTVTIQVPQQTSSALPTHTHTINGLTNSNGTTENIVKNTGINYIIKAKPTSSTTSSSLTIVTDRIMKGDGMLVQTETSLISNKFLDMGGNKITNLPIGTQNSDAINLQQLNLNTSQLTTLMDSKDLVVKNGYISADVVVTNGYLAGDVVLNNKIDTFKNILIDPAGNYLQLLNGYVTQSGIQALNLAGVQINCATDISLNNNAVNVSTLKAYHPAYLESATGTVDRAGFYINNNFDVSIDNSTKLNINNTDATLNVPLNTLVQYNNIPTSSIVNNQTIVHKQYVDSSITTAIANIPSPSVSAKYARFESNNNSGWQYSTHNLFGSGSVYILKPQNSCFTQIFNNQLELYLYQTGGHQYFRCLQSGIYKVEINMTVQVGIPQNAVQFTSWLNGFLFGRHLQWPTNSSQPHRYNSLLSGFTADGGYTLLKGHKSIFEICSGILPFYSGTNMVGPSYDQVAYHVKFSGILQLQTFTNYFIHGPVVFDDLIQQSSVISNVYDCSVDFQLLT